MKNAVILHGLNGNHKENWFECLGRELENKGYKVFIPDLPEPGTPDLERWTNFIFENWEFDEDSVIVGHSAGAVEVMRVLERLPENLVIEKAIMVAGFLNDLGRPALIGMFKKSFDFEKIKKSVKEIILIHSDNDPAVPIENAYNLERELGAKLVIMKGQGHFNLEAGEKYRRFPELLDLI